MGDVQHRRTAMGAIIAAVSTMAFLYACYLTIGFWAGAGAASSQYLSIYIIGPLNLLLPIVVGALWFRFNANRVMSHAERLRFAFGVVLVSTIITVLFAFGAPIRLSLGPLFAKALLQLVALHFVVAYGLGWLLTLRFGDGSQPRAGPRPR